MLLDLRFYNASQRFRNPEKLFDWEYEFHPPQTNVWSRGASLSLSKMYKQWYPILNKIGGGDGIWLILF